MLVSVLSRERGYMEAEYDPTTATGQLVFLETSPCSGLQRTGVLFIFFDVLFDLGDFLPVDTAGSGSSLCTCPSLSSTLTSV